MNTSGTVTLRVAKSDHGITDNDNTSDRWERDINDALFSSGNEQTNTYTYTPPVRIASVTHPAGPAPLTLGRARWVVKFTEPIRIGDVGTVDPATGRIKTGLLAARNDAAESSSNAALVGYNLTVGNNADGSPRGVDDDRIWVVQRCATTDASCTDLTLTTAGNTILGRNEYQVYTSDLQTITEGSLTREFGTTFIIQMKNVGLAATNHLQLILRPNFSFRSVTNESYNFADLPATGPLSRAGIWAISPAGSATLADTRVATIVADTPSTTPPFNGPSKIEYDATNSVVRATVKFTNLTANVTPEDFTIESNNFADTRFDAGTVVRPLDATDPTYIFTAPVAENTETTTPHDIRLTWNPRPGITHTSTFGNDDEETFTFASGTEIASVQSTLPAVADTKAPTVSFVRRSDSAGANVGSVVEPTPATGTVYYLVRFDEPVTGVEDGDFHAVITTSATTVIPNSATTIAPKASSTTDYIVAVDLSSVDGGVITDQDAIALRVATDDHNIADTASTPVAWARNVNQTILSDDTNGEIYRFVAPPSIASVTLPPTATPITFAQARWIITFNEPVLIGPNNSVVDVNGRTGRINAGVFSPRSGSDSALATTDRAFVMQRCNSSTACPAAGNGADLSPLSTHYEVYTKDLETVGTNRFGTTFIYQLKSLSGFSATNRLQLVIPNAFAVQNKQGGILTVGRLATSGTTSRLEIQTPTGVGAANADIRQATIIPELSSVELRTTGNSPNEIHSIRTRVYFTHNTTDISPFDFTLTSDATTAPVFGNRTEVEALDNDNSIYIFDTIISNNTQAASQNITVNWTPRTSVTSRSASHGTITDFTFAFDGDTTQSPTDFTLASASLTIPTVTDSTAPTLSSVSATTVATSISNDRAVTWIVRFDEAVDFDLDNFAFTGTISVPTPDPADLRAVNGTTVSGTTYASEWRFLATAPGSGTGTITGTANVGMVQDQAGNTLDLTTTSAPNNVHELDWTTFTSNIIRRQRLIFGGSENSGGLTVLGGNTNRGTGNPDPALSVDTRGTLGNPFRTQNQGSVIHDYTEFGLDLGYSGGDRAASGASIIQVEAGQHTHYNLADQLQISCEIIGTPAATCTDNFTAGMTRFANSSTNSYRLVKTAVQAAVPDGRIAKFTISTLFPIPNRVPYSNIDIPIAAQESNVFYFADDSDASTSPVTFPDAPTVTSSVVPSNSGATQTITYTATYATTPAEALVDGFVYTERAADNAPSNANDSENPSTYGLHFDCYDADCSSVQVTSANASRTGNVDTITLVLGTVTANDVFDVSLRTGMRAITEQITAAGATATVNPTTPITVTFGNPVATNYDVSWTITFDAIINLTQAAHAGLFAITSPDGDITDLALTDVTDVSNTTGKEYRISGFLPGTPGSNTSSIYTASFTPTVTLQTASSNRRVSRATVTAPQTQSIDYTNIPLPAITNIELENIVPIGDEVVNFVATFNYPVRGVADIHFAVLSSTYSSDPAIGTPVGIAPAIRSGSVDYFTKFRIPTASVTVDANSSIVLRADIATDEVTQIIPLGTQTEIAVSDASTNPIMGGGILAADIIAPTIMSVTRDSGEFLRGGMVSWTVEFNEGIEATSVDTTGGTDFVITLGTGASAITVVADVSFVTNSDNQLSVEVDLPDTSSYTTDTPLTISLNASTGITDDAGTPNGLDTTTSSPVVTGADQYLLNARAITATFGTPTTNNANDQTEPTWSISVPITFDPPVTLDPANLDHIGAFSIAAGAGGDATDITIAPADPNDLTNGEYIITGLLAGTPGTGGTASTLHGISFVPPTGANILYGNASPNLAASLTTAPTIPTITIEYPTIPVPILEGITFDRSSLPANGAAAQAVNFIATFNYPVRDQNNADGPLPNHYFDIASTNLSPAPTIVSVTGDSATSVTLNGAMHYTRWTIATSDVTYTEGASSTITITSNLDSIRAPLVNPIGNFAGVEVDEATTVEAIFDQDTDAPTLTSVTRTDSSGGGTPDEPISGGPVYFIVTFSELVSGVDMADFTVSSGDITAFDTLNIPAPDTQYLVTVGNFPASVTTDTDVILSLTSSDSATLGIIDTSTTNPAHPNVGNLFVPNDTNNVATTVLADIATGTVEKFILNTDDDDVVLTIDAEFDLQQFPLVGGRVDARWNIEFDKPIENLTAGADLANAEVSDQFAVQITGEFAGTSHEGPIQVRVYHASGSGTTANQSFVVTATMPTIGFPTATTLNLNTTAEFNNVVQADNIHNNHVVFGTLQLSGLLTASAGRITSDTANTEYSFTTGGLEVTNLTSIAGDARAIQFLISFGSRVSLPSDLSTLFTITGSGTPEVSLATATPVRPPYVALADYDSNTFHDSLLDGGTQTGQFAYTWMLTTTEVAATETDLSALSPVITMISTTGITAEGPSSGSSALGDITLPTGVDATHTHQFRDEIAPKLESISRVGTADRTTNGDASWLVRFDEPVTAVVQGPSNQFEVRRDGTAITTATITVSGTDREYTVAVSGITVASPTDSVLTLHTTDNANAIMDLSTSPSPNAFNNSDAGTPSPNESFAYNTDTTASVATARADNDVRVTESDISTTWLVTFTRPVNGTTISTDDFEIITDPPAATGFSLDVSAPNCTADPTLCPTSTVLVNLDFPSTPSLTDIVVDLRIKSDSDIVDVTPNANPVAKGSITAAGQRYIYNTDTDAPTATVTATPASRFTNGTIPIVWTIQFSRDVTGVDEDDFSVVTVNSSGAISGTVDLDVDISAQEVEVTARLPETGNDDSIELKLVYDDEGRNTITDTSSNANIFALFNGTTTVSAMDLQATPFVFTYSTSTANPTVSSVTRMSPSDELFRSGGNTVSWRIAFSLPVDNVTVGGVSDQFKIRYEPAQSGAPEGLTLTRDGTSNVYTALSSSISLTSLTDVTMSVVAIDTVVDPSGTNAIVATGNTSLAFITSADGLLTSPSSNENYILNTDETAPSVTSVTVGTIAVDATVSTIEWSILYSEAVSGVTTSSLTVTRSLSVSAPTTTDNTTWTFTSTHNNPIFGVVTATTVSDGIMDGGRNELSGTPTSQTHTFDLLTVDSITRAPSDALLNGETESIVWTITYVEDAPAPIATTYSVSCVSTPICSVDSVSSRVSEKVHSVTVSNLSQLEGVLNLIEGTDAYAEYNSHSASSAARTVMVDTIAPTLVENGISEPVSSGGTIVWTITFTEDVTRFTTDNVTITGSTEVPVISGTGSVWTVTLTTASNDAISLAIEPSDDSSLVTTDLAGNELIVGVSVSERQEIAMAVITEFVSSSAAQYVNSAPSLASRLTRLPSSSSSRSPTSSGGGVLDDSRTNFSASVDNNSMNMNLGMDIGNHSFATTMTDSQKTFEYDGVFSLGEGLPALWDLDWFSGTDSFAGYEVWLQTTYSSTESDLSPTDTSESQTVFVHLGIDTQLSDGAILGALLQLDMTDHEGMNVMVGSNQHRVKLESTGFMFGPYYAKKILGVNFEGRVSMGLSSVELDPIGTYIDEYDTTRLYASASLSQDLENIYNNWSLSPRIEYSFYTEEQSRYTDNNPTGIRANIPGSEFKLSRFAFGPELSRRVYTRGGGIMTPSMSITGVFDSTETTTSTGRATDNISTGKLDFGLDYNSPTGISWNFGGYYDIITEAETTSYGMTSGLGIRF